NAIGVIDETHIPVIVGKDQQQIYVYFSKYYLVDSRYANTDRFLVPYRGERYHLSQFDSIVRARTHRNPKDLYNHRHAQLKNMVEKTFGILKKWFKILNHATPFPYKVQCMVAMACCVVHNFIRRQ
ncbi:hypothetical protein ACMD2_19178, partial [Ananas comosus]